jgi:hypothetical protein
MKNSHLSLSRKLTLYIICCSLLTFTSCEKESNNVEKSIVKLDSEIIGKSNLQYNKSSFTYIIESLDNSVLATYENTEYLITYSSNDFNLAEFTTNLKILDKTSGIYLIDNDVSQDLTEEYYKLYTRNNLVNNANTLLQSTVLEHTFFLSFSEILHNFYLNIRIDVGDIYFQDIKYSGFNYHLSILNMVKRAKGSSQQNCECNTIGIYFEVDRGFACSQDVFFNKSAVVNYLHFVDTVLYADSMSGVDSSLIQNLNNLPTTTISYEQFAQQVTMIPGGSAGTDPISGADKTFCFEKSGSDLGCCGNYSGPCWYCSTPCLIHDLICICCNYPVMGSCGLGCQSAETC